MDHVKRLLEALDTNSTLATKRYTEVYSALGNGLTTAVELQNHLKTPPNVIRPLLERLVMCGVVQRGREDKRIRYSQITLQNLDVDRVTNAAHILEMQRVYEQARDQYKTKWGATP